MPDIPQYAPSKPAESNCGGSNANGLNIINPPDGGGGGKNAEVIAGFSMQVNDLSDVDTDRFEVNYAAYETISVALTLVLKALGVIKPQPVLKGTIIDVVECDWAYNAARDADISIQTLVNTGAPSDPVLSGAERDSDYDSLNITEDKTVTVYGTDTRSNDTDVEPITFGNILAIGVSSPSLLFQLPANIQAAFDALVSSRETEVNQITSFNAYGTNQEYMTIAHPASWGESEFQKGTAIGGYQRIWSVNRGGNFLLVNELIAGDVELDININNGNGFTEPYFFYQSEFSERTADKPTFIRKA